jgi:hypothetical protein
MDTRVPLRELAGQHPQIAELLGERDLDELFRPDYYLRNAGVAASRLGLTS